MIAASRYGQPARRGERALIIALVASIHIGLAVAILSSFSVRLDARAESPLELIDIEPLSPPPLPPPPPPPPKKSDHASASAPALRVVPNGGNPVPAKPKIPAPTVPVAIIALPAATAPIGGGLAGQGAASAGTGAGGGAGGNGTGEGGGGTDLYQIAGAIGPRDYPRALRDSGVGGRVLMTFTVAPTGRVSRCVVTGSSGVPELDELTCRLIRERFLFRPETDRYGRAIATEVDGDHLWTARSRN